MTTTRITDADIMDLRREARLAGDAAQVELCDLALGLSDLRAEQEMDDAGHGDTDFQRAFGRPLATRLAEAQAAWDACVQAIEAAEAMGEDVPDGDLA